MVSIKNKSFSITAEVDETTDIGYESAHTSRFTGQLHWVQLDTGDDDHDHFITPEERFRVAVARQYRGRPVRSRTRPLAAK